MIHRDIKPENILLQDGQALVADFGIALAIRAAGGERLTETGLSLGTPLYMSPEQATGDRQLDARSDIYSLGSVLYEMLAGQPPYTGPTTQAIIAKLLTEPTPRLRVLRDTVPAALEQAVLKALAKLSADRFATAADFADALGRATTGVGGMAVEVAPRRSRIAVAFGSLLEPAQLRLAVPWGVAVLLAVGLAWGWLRPTPPPPVSRFAVGLPPGKPLSPNDAGTIALSPNGRQLVYVGVGEHGPELYLRPLDQLDIRPLPGTENGHHPFFSPDGEWVGFFANGKLKKVALAGGPPLTLADAPALDRGASWGPDGTILYAPTSTTGLLRVSAAGGVPDTVTRLTAERGETSHRWPEFLPGGKAALFTIQSSGGAAYSVAALLLKTGEVKPLLREAVAARYAPTGHLVYATPDGSLLAVPFDLGRLAVTGSPVSLLEGVLVNPSTGSAEFALSRDGSLLYVSGSAPEQQLVLVDRQGVERPLTGKLRLPAAPRFSPDGRHVALSLVEAGTSNVWIYDVSQGTLSRLTFEGDNAFPEWTPDGRRVAFSSSRPGSKGRHLFWKAADGSGADEPLLTADLDQWEATFTPDGRTLVYRQVAPNTGRDLWVLPLEGDRTPRPFLVTPFQERAPTFSPDGRWLAYVSDESGHDEVYVRAFPGPGGRWQVSTAGGTEPRWARSGRELFYRSGDTLLAAQVSTGPVFSVGSRKALFTGRFAVQPNHAGYDVHPDGRQFLMVKSAAEPSDLVLVLNWFEELRRRVRAGR